MKLMPDVSTAVIDPFFAQSTLAVFCDVLEPLTNEPYERDPRGIAGKAEAYLKQTGVGDTAVFGPEAEFFVFDDVRFKADPFNCGYKIDSIELPSNMDTDYEMGNLGHRPRTKGGYFPVPPIDRRRISARRCSASWRTWASSPRSITTRWAQPSTSLASSSARW